MKIKFKKLNPNASVPTKAHEHDAGFDLTCVSKGLEGKSFVYGTGLAIQIPEGHVGLVFPRSSISKKDLILSNSVGVIDCGYIGEIMFKFKRTLVGDSLANIYEIGDRIGQLIIMPIPSIEFEEVSELEQTERGQGGYGSTGM
jgi:dUTP pyrophosphatase